MASAPKRGRILPRNIVPAHEVIERVMEEGSDEELELFSELAESDEEGESDEGELYIPGDNEGDDDVSDSDNGSDFDTSAVVNDDEYNVDTDNDSEPIDSEEEDVWVKNFRHFPRVPAFEGKPGIHIDLGDNPTPLDVYRVFMTDDFIKLMMSQTNLYARRAIEAKERSGVQLSPRSLFKKWTPVTLDEICKFLAILIHMGLVKKPQIADYWSKDITLRTDFARKVMKHNRFMAILAFWHLNDNNEYIPKGREGHDPIHKVRPLFSHMNEKFKEVYTPTRNICIDEAMCPWRGRAAFRVYMRDKPTKWGIKLYELCESKSGYIHNFEVMCHEPQVSNKPVDVCLRLSTPFHDKGYWLFVDNDYCCPQLCSSLLERKTMVVGTVRANRVGMPKDLVTQAMDRGAVDYRRKGQTVALRWKDKRDVNVLSTVHTDTMVHTRSQSGVEKNKPKAVVDYTTNRAEVDKSDQIISYLPLHRKTVKWWKKLALHFITIMMIQSHIIFNKHRHVRRWKQWQLDTFVKSVCKSLAVFAGADLEDLASNNAANLTGDANQARNEGAAPPPPPPRPAARRAAGEESELSRLTGLHFPKNTGVDARGRKRRHECHVCYTRARAGGTDRQSLRNTRVTTTNFECRVCDKKLCLDCFEIYHTVLDYAG